MGPNHPNRHPTKQEGDPHRGAPPWGDGRARERWPLTCMVHQWIQRDRTLLDQEDVPLPQHAAARDPVVP